MDPASAILLAGLPEIPEIPLSALPRTGGDGTESLRRLPLGLGKRPMNMRSLSTFNDDPNDTLLDTSNTNMMDTGNELDIQILGQPGAGTSTSRGPAGGAPPRPHAASTSSVPATTLGMGAAPGARSLAALSEPLPPNSAPPPRPKSKEPAGLMHHISDPAMGYKGVSLNHQKKKQGTGPASHDVVVDAADPKAVTAMKGDVAAALSAFRQRQQQVPPQPPAPLQPPQPPPPAEAKGAQAGGAAGPSGAAAAAAGGRQDEQNQQQQQQQQRKQQNAQVDSEATASEEDEDDDDEDDDEEDEAAEEEEERRRRAMEARERKEGADLDGDDDDDGVDYTDYRGDDKPLEVPNIPLTEDMKAKAESWLDSQEANPGHVPVIKVRGDPVIAGAKYGTMHQHYVQESHRRARQRLLTKTDAFQSLAASSAMGPSNPQMAIDKFFETMMQSYGLPMHEIVGMINQSLERQQQRVGDSSGPSNDMSRAFASIMAQAAAQAAAASGQLGPGPAAAAMGGAGSGPGPGMGAAAAAEPLPQRPMTRGSSRAAAGASYGPTAHHQHQHQHHQHHHHHQPTSQKEAMDAATAAAVAAATAAAAAMGAPSESAPAAVPASAGPLPRLAANTPGGRNSRHSSAASMQAAAAAEAGEQAGGRPRANSGASQRPPRTPVKTSSPSQGMQSAFASPTEQQVPLPPLPEDAAAQLDMMSFEQIHPEQLNSIMMMSAMSLEPDNLLVSNAGMASNPAIGSLPTASGLLSSGGMGASLLNSLGAAAPPNGPGGVPAAGGGPGGAPGAGPSGVAMTGQMGGARASLAHALSSGMLNSFDMEDLLTSLEQDIVSSSPAKLPAGISPRSKTPTGPSLPPWAEEENLSGSHAQAGHGPGPSDQGDAGRGRAAMPALPRAAGPGGSAPSSAPQFHFPNSADGAAVAAAELGFQSNSSENLRTLAATRAEALSVIQNGVARFTSPSSSSGPLPRLTPAMVAHAASRGIVDTSLGGLPGSQSGPPAWGLSFSNPGDGAPQAAGGKGLPGVNGGRASRTFTGPDGQPVPAPPAHPHGLNECASEPIPKLPPTTGTHHDTPFFAGLERGPSMGFIDGSLFDNVGLTIGDEEDMHHHHRAASIPLDGALMRQMLDDFLPGADELLHHHHHHPNHPSHPQHPHQTHGPQHPVGPSTVSAPPLHGMPHRNIGPDLGMPHPHLPSPPRGPGGLPGDDYISENLLDAGPPVHRGLGKGGPLGLSHAPGPAQQAALLQQQQQQQRLNTAPANMYGMTHHQQMMAAAAAAAAAVTAGVPTMDHPRSSPFMQAPSPGPNSAAAAAAAAATAAAVSAGGSGMHGIPLPPAVLTNMASGNSDLGGPSPGGTPKSGARRSPKAPNTASRLKANDSGAFGSLMPGAGPSGDFNNEGGSDNLSGDSGGETTTGTPRRGAAAGCCKGGAAAGRAARGTTPRTGSGRSRAAQGGGGGEGGGADGYGGGDDGDGTGLMSEDPEEIRGGDDVTLRPANGTERRKISKQILQEVYHLPINEAADRLNIGVTVLKKYCRKFNVGRWPFRKLKSMDKLIKSVQEQASHDPAGAAAVLAQLHAFKEEIYQNPEVVLDERIKKLRQANFKLEYKQRQANNTVGAPPVAGMPGAPLYPMPGGPEMPGGPMFYPPPGGMMAALREGMEPSEEGDVGEDLLASPTLVRSANRGARGRLTKP